MKQIDLRLNLLIVHCKRYNAVRLGYMGRGPVLCSDLDKVLCCTSKGRKKKNEEKKSLMLIRSSVVWFKIILAINIFLRQSLK